MALGRRTILRYGVGGALLLATGGLGLGLQPTRPRSPSRPLRALRPRSFSVLVVVADRLIGGGGGLPDAADLQVAERIDELLSLSHPGVAREVEQVLSLLENALVGLAFGGEPRPFTALPPEAQDAVLRDWRTSRWKVRRTAYRALHGLCMGVAFSAPETYPAAAYPGPPTFAAKGTQP